MAIPRSFRRKLLVFIGLGSAVFLILALYPERRELVEAASRFNWWWLPAALALALVNYAVRAGRWLWYLHYLGVSIPARESISIFLIGLMLSVTPGKAGELFKAYLIRLARGVPMSRTAPIILVERLTDLTGTLILVTLSLVVVQFKVWMVLAGWVVLFGGLFVLGSRTIFRGLLGTFGRFIPHGWLDRIERTYESLSELLAPKPLIGGTLLSAVAWFAECLSLLVIVHGFGEAIGWIEATFVYTLATLAGAVLFFMPGGIGGTEATMVALLEEIVGTPVGVASLATVLTRMATLWFAAAIGFVALIYCPLPISEDVDKELEQGADLA